MEHLAPCRGQWLQLLFCFYRQRLRLEEDMVGTEIGGDIMVDIKDLEDITDMILMNLMNPMK